MKVAASVILDLASYHSPNHEPRHGTIDMIILHSCEGAIVDKKGHPIRGRDSSLPWLCNPVSKVSSHYYICRPDTDGQVWVYRLVEESEIAWHAGLSLWQGVRNLNRISIGIEMEHRRGQDWPHQQLMALDELCRAIVLRHADITQDRILPHRLIAVDKLDRRGRKDDPTDWTNEAISNWAKVLFSTTRGDSIPRLGPNGAACRWYRVLPKNGVHVRTRADVASDTIDSLPQGTQILGYEQAGVAYSGDPLWVGRLGTRGRNDKLASGGFIWRRLLEYV